MNKTINDIGASNTIIHKPSSNGDIEYYISIAFYDEYDKKRDSTPCRKRKLKTDKLGFYITHKGEKYYYDKEIIGED